MIICLAHKRDLDGIGCHAILKRHAMKNDIEIENIYVDYNDLITKLRFKKHLKDKIFIIADLGFTKEFLNNIETLKKISKKNLVYWIDHHDWSSFIKHLENIDIKLVIDKNYCASELTWLEFEKNDEICKRIAYYARLHDFMVTNSRDFEHSMKLYEVIASRYLDYDYIAEELAMGNFWNNKFEEAYEYYYTKKNNVIKYSLKTFKVYDIKDIKFGIVLYKDISATSVSLHFLNNYDIDFIICCTTRGRISFRRKTKKVNMVELAKLFNGGGREDAASANLEKRITTEDFDRIANVVMRFISGFD